MFTRGIKIGHHAPHAVPIGVDAMPQCLRRLPVRGHPRTVVAKHAPQRGLSPHQQGGSIKEVAVMGHVS